MSAELRMRLIFWGQVFHQWFWCGLPWREAREEAAREILEELDRLDREDARRAAEGEERTR